MLLPPKASSAPETAPLAPVAKPRVIGHRGASHVCPENAFSAFDEALAQGADGLELDLQLTYDGAPVVFHDHTLRKLGQRRQKLSALTLEQLSHIDFGGWFGEKFRGERLPTLGGLLERYATRTTLCLEMKASRDFARNSALVEQTVGQIHESGLQDSVFVLCFDEGMLSEAHRLVPDIRYVLNSFSTLRALREAATRPWLYGIDVAIPWLTPKGGEKLREGGRCLMSYTCDTEEQLRAAQAAGVEYVICNRPAWAREWLERH